MRADEVIRVGTEAATVEQLIAQSGKVVDGDAIIAKAANLSKPGERKRFQILLVDGTVALEGVGEVVAGATGRLKIVELEGSSKELHARIVSTRAAAKPSTRVLGGRTAPPPFRKPGDPNTPPPTRLPPPPAAGSAHPERAHVVAPAAPPAAAKPAPAPAPEPAAAAPATAAPIDAIAMPADAARAGEERMSTDVVLRWQPPPWLRSRRNQTILAVVGAILLIGIIAAFAADPPKEPASPEPSASRTDPSSTKSKPTPSPSTIANAGSSGDTDATDTAAPIDDTDTTDTDETAPDVTDTETAAVDAEPDPEPAAEPKRATKKPAKRKTSSTRNDSSTSRRHRETKRTTTTSKQKPSTTSRQVRLTVRTDPPGASIKVDGRGLDNGAAMVTAGSTVKVTATKRGYKRTTKSVKVGKGTSITIKLEKM